MSDRDDDAANRQGTEWETLYGEVKRTLARWGVEDAFGEGDYLIVDDNYGHNRQIVEVHKLRMLKSIVVEELRTLLGKFPHWEIVLALDIPDKEYWPPMGVTIRNHEIIDGLLRQYLPPEFAALKIPGSRPGTGYD